MNAELTEILGNEEETLAFGARLAKVLDKEAVVFLYGQLGTGKTTLVRGLLRGLGFTQKVKSPTYTLVESYIFNELTFYHFDLYRLVEARELKDIGIEEYFSPASVCLIEWPEKGSPLLPSPDIACYIDFIGTKRQIRLEACSVHGGEMMRRL